MVRRVMKQEKNILIIGKMATGKTTIADYITRYYPRYKKVSFATWLKRTIMTHYDLAEIDKSMSINGKSLRTLMQELGMYMRAIDPNWHIDELRKTIIEPFVIDDVRFQNEIEVLTRYYNCVIIKSEVSETNRIIRILERDRLVPTEKQLNDKSETEVDMLKYDVAINNDGNIDELVRQLEALMRAGIRRYGI